MTEKWTRSTACADAACIEVALLGDDRIGVRDSKRPEQAPLTVGRDQWHAFLDEVRAGRFQDL